MGISTRNRKEILHLTDHTGITRESLGYRERSLVHHPGYQQGFGSVSFLLSLQQLSLLLRLGSVTAKPQPSKENREQSYGQSSSLLGILVSGLAFLDVCFHDHVLSLGERYQTHPQPSHSALASLDLRFLQVRFPIHVGCKLYMLSAQTVLLPFLLTEL